MYGHRKCLERKNDNIHIGALLLLCISSYVIIPNPASFCIPAELAHNDLLALHANIFLLMSFLFGAPAPVHDG
jgi:hypothetical protein